MSDGKMMKDSEMAMMGTNKQKPKSMPKPKAKKKGK